MDKDQGLWSGVLLFTSLVLPSNECLRRVKITVTTVWNTGETGDIYCIDNLSTKVCISLTLDNSTKIQNF